MNRPLTGAVLLLLAATSLVACSSGSKRKPDQVAAQAYLSALGRADASTAATHTDAETPARSAISASLAGLGAGVRATFTITSMTGRTSSASTANYSAKWTVPGSGTPWTYSASLPLVKTSNGWQVHWAITDVAPQLKAGEHLSASHTQATRAALLDSDGQPLFTEQPVVIVGINPAMVTDLPTLAATLAAALGLNAADITASVQAAPPTQFVQLITLRQAAYQAVRDKIHDLPGTQFETSTELLGPDAQFAQPLLGRVGPATADLIAGSKGTISAGDTTGLSGLQLGLNAQLTGTPGLSIWRANDSDGSDVTKLADVSAPVPAKPVMLTLNRADQTAAEAALAAIPLPAAVVLTQPSTGKILAVANTPATAGQDIALDGQYPPGSTFKMVTYTAAFTADPTLTPATPEACPGSVVVDGQTFVNENGFDKGTIPVSAAFAYSCNTTAIGLGTKLPVTALGTAAAALGLGAKWTLPVDSFSGSIPTPASLNEQAADSIGQGKVLVSPLLMASIAAAATTGVPVAPSLMLGQQASPGTKQPAAVTADLNALMRAVITQPGATGAGLAALPGQVEGKTGTAEFGSAVPPQSHSWFAGTRGDLAISVFVYGGEHTAYLAVPIASAILKAIPA